VNCRSEGKNKREELKQPVDGGAHETCKGEDERATGDWSPQVIFPSPSPSPPSPRSLPLFLAPFTFAFAFASTPTDLCVAPVRSLPLVAPPFVPFHRLKSCVLAFFAFDLHLLHLP
jgi:hypothetical protein